MTSETKQHPQAILDAIYAILWDDEEGDWRELQSCADAIQDICLVLGAPGPERICDEPARKIYASYVSCTAHSIDGIELHRSYRYALETVADFFNVAVDGKDDEEIYQAIEQAADGESWHIQEVEIP